MFLGHKYLFDRAAQMNFGRGAGGMASGHRVGESRTGGIATGHGVGEP